MPFFPGTLFFTPGPNFLYTALQMSHDLKFLENLSTPPLTCQLTLRWSCRIQQQDPQVNLPLITSYCLMKPNPPFSSNATSPEAITTSRHFRSRCSQSMQHFRRYYGKAQIYGIQWVCRDSGTNVVGMWHFDAAANGIVELKTEFLVECWNQ